MAAAIGVRADIVWVGEGPASAPGVEHAIRAAGLTVKTVAPTAVVELNRDDARVVVVAGRDPLPPGSRRALTRFLETGGHAVIVGAHTFDYAPKPVRAVPLARLADEGQRIVRVDRKRGERPMTRGERPQREKITGPDGWPAWLFQSRERGMEDFLVELDPKPVRSPRRNVLQFWAKGDAYMDLLAVEIRDDGGRTWHAFVPIGGEWKQYALSMADFLPEGWDRPDEPYPLLAPETIASVGLGTNLHTVWPEKPMSLALGSVDLAEHAGAFYAPTSALLALRLPFLENGIRTPAWLFDPFAGSVRIVTENGWSGAAGNRVPRDGLREAASCPAPHIEHPGIRMGTDHRADYILKFERETRRVPLWTALNAAGAPAAVAAELRIAATGKARGANVALFGFTLADIARHPALAQSLADTIVAIAGRPKIAGGTINTTEAGADGQVSPVLEIVAQNPLPGPLRGRVVVSVAEGRVRGETEVRIEGRATAVVAVPLSAVPADFPFTRFAWSAKLETDAGTDELRDVVDVERGLLHASRHLLATQRQFPDGRISHHYFGDAYGVRAMLAYADLVRREPGRQRSNADLWRGLAPGALEEGGLRCFDMLSRRQLPEGPIPMGYSEHASGYNVADGGQMALGVGQVLPLVRDAQRKESYLEFCRRFVSWAETFYIDEKRSAELAARLPERAKKGETKVGHYGIGQGARTRSETGPSWVLPDILGVQTLLTYVDPNPDYRRIAARNIRAYLDAGYGAAGYFHAEALVWAWLSDPDPVLRKRIAETLRATFLPPLLKGNAHDMYTRGARSQLNGLPLIYYRRYIEDTPAVRAVLLKYVWAFASEDAPNAMRRVAETFPKPAHGESIAASKQAACGAIWAMELLEPGSSLLRIDGFPRVPPGK